MLRAGLPAVPGVAALPQPADAVGRRPAPGIAVATIAYLLAGGDDSGTATSSPSRSDSLSASRSAAGAGGLPPHVGLDHAVRDRCSSCSTGSTGPCCPATGRTTATTSTGLTGFIYHHAGGHLRHGGRCLVVADHPVHHLRRVPAGVRAPASSSSTSPSPRWAASTPGAGRTVVLSSFLLGGPSGSGVATTVTHRHGRLADAEARRLRPRGCGRPARRRRARRDHLAAGAGRGGLPDRRVPQDQLPRRAADGGRCRPPLLPVAVPDGGARRAHASRLPAMAAAGDGRTRPAAAEAATGSTSVAGRDRRLHAVGFSPVPVGVLGDDRHGGGIFLRARDGNGADARSSTHCPTARCRRWASPRPAPRPGIIVGVVAKTGLGLKFSDIVIDYAGGQPVPHRAVHGADRLGRRPRGAGDGQLHHLRGGRRAGADQARRAGLRGAHVRLLLRGALRGLAADRAFALRGRGDHRRRARTGTTLQSWKYTLPGLRGALRLRARPRGRRACCSRRRPTATGGTSRGSP